MTIATLAVAHVSLAAVVVRCNRGADTAADRASDDRTVTSAELVADRRTRGAAESSADRGVERRVVGSGDGCAENESGEKENGFHIFCLPLLGCPKAIAQYRPASPRLQ